MIEILDSTAAHARELSQTMREQDRLEALRMGLDPRKAIFYVYRRAFFRKTVLVDGRVAAMYGIVGSPIQHVNYPYLMTSSEVQKVPPLVFTRVYLKAVKEMTTLASLLEGYVDFEYSEAIRLLRIAGFTLSKPVCYGPNNELFCRFQIAG